MCDSYKHVAIIVYHAHRTQTIDVPLKIVTHAFWIALKNDTLLLQFEKHLFNIKRTICSSVYSIFRSTKDLVEKEKRANTRSLAWKPNTCTQCSRHTVCKCRNNMNNRRKASHFPHRNFSRTFLSFHLQCQRYWMICASNCWKKKKKWKNQQNFSLVHTTNEFQSKEHFVINVPFKRHKTA